MHPSSSFVRVAAISLVVATALGCYKEAAPVADREPSPSAAPIAASAEKPASVASAPSPAPSIPSLVLESFAPAGTKLSAVYRVEGATLVVEEFRVGRVVGDKIEWLKKTVPSSAPFGNNRIDSVVGSWPDGVGAIYSNDSGRAPQPAYLPLTGAGVEFSPGVGGYSNILGVARIGASLLVAGARMGFPIELHTVHGTAKRQPKTEAEFGCKKLSQGAPGQPAVATQTIGATTEGTLFSVGELCDERGVAIEVWDKRGASRILELRKWWKKSSYGIQLVAGSGDEMWLLANRFGKLLRYRNGEIEAAPELEHPILNLFASPKGELYAYDGRTIHRFDGKAWAPFAEIAAPGEFARMIMDESETIWTGGVFRFKKGPSVSPPAACATPFVYLYDVKRGNGPKFTYPATRKALASFADVAATTLVEFGNDADKQLGVALKTRAQAEALIQHLHETMKEEDPGFFCFDVTKAVKPRTIDLSGEK